jgi:hypothetical protein
MKNFLTMVLLGFSVMAIAQQKITFEYDKAGNQTYRKLCINCTNKKSKVIIKETPKEIAALTEEDLEKFTPNDVISYYPNPVREELYLKWELTNNNYVKVIQVYNFNGQILNSYTQSDRSNTQTIPFHSYPSGNYLVVLQYQSGEQKTINIIKR